MPKRPAKLPKSPPKPAPPRKSKGGRPPAYDWQAIRREYVRGGDDVTYRTLSLAEGSPAEDTIERRGANEDWTDLRLSFRREVDRRMQAADLDVKMEVRKRHAQIGKAMLALAGRGLQKMVKDERTMDSIDVIRFARAGAELERKALNMDEQTVNFRNIRSPDDLDKLSEADLWRLAGQLPPDELEDFPDDHADE